MPHVKDYKAGASLRMWRDYFPNATIYGVDINRNAVAEANDPPRIITKHIDDGYAYPKFDLVVDDGSHDPDDQLKYFELLRLSMAPNSLYIIEDVDEYSLKQNILSPHLPEHSVVHHVHKDGIGRLILIHGKEN
jgi:hypothetical protein